jgi:outer membrane receptor protein involved in Fe transport
LRIFARCNVDHPVHVRSPDKSQDYVKPQAAADRRGCFRTETLLNTNNRRVASSRIALSVLAILGSAAQAQTVAEWDLPKQPLADSLREVAARTDSNILFDKGLVAGQSARPLKMRASADEALTQLLEGTGLTYRHLDDKTVTIQSVAASQKSSSTSLAGSGDGRIRLAQAETGTGRAEERLPIVDGKQLLDIEEIIVTGTNIRGVENSTVPLIVLDRAYIDASGISTTTRLIESLPQNFAFASQSSVPVIGITDARTQGSSVNLRAIGEGTTLVLLNGRRIASGFFGSAVDIAALPISAIERVEILTDGASALYGSDAVGGVVNFILRSDFDGAETRLRGGSADGADEYSVSQLIGNAWDSGNVLFSAEYYQRDLLLANERDFVPDNFALGSLLPDDENYSAMFTVRQDLSSSVSVFADALYTNRDSFNRSGRILQNETYKIENPQVTAALGVNWRIAGDWQLEASGSYGNYDLTQTQTSTIVANSPVRQDSEFDIEGARLKADGSLFETSAGKVRAAIGAEYRSESFEFKQVNAIGVSTSAPIDSDQNVRSAFAELFVPIVGDGNSLPGIYRLELSLAGRYDEYSKFGSSFDPKYGLAWQPVRGLTLRGSYGTSYVAPRLLDYNLATTRGFGLRGADPGAPPPTSRQVQILGTDVTSLGPQESDNLSLGLEIAPASLPGFEFAVNYYDIDYTDRIANPPSAAVILGNPAAFGDLFIRNPTLDQVNEAIRISQLGGNPFVRVEAAFNPAAVNAIVDLRRRNLSATNTSGLDLSTRYNFHAGSSNFSLGVAGTYVLELEQRITDTSQPIDTVDTYQNPPHWRARGSAGWQIGGWATNLFVNQTDSYTDKRVVTAPREISSYTTVDLRIAYDFSANFKDGVFSGLTLAAGALNLLDKDPPRTAVIAPTTDLGFDPANASPLGRLISIELTKTW